MPNHLINIEVDGKIIQIREGAMLIEAIDEARMAEVPRFCYHKKLSIAANCRMCLVQVEKAPKPLPACATPVAEGMKVFTTSQITRAAQKSVMEFLLINHPLDCPVCDQGGECELQDLALMYGMDKGVYNQAKRSVQDKDIGPLISTEMTRCIHCTRCVRFGEEIAGMRELGATGRGEHMEIGTYLEHHLDSELSGNIIDLCPVGALTSKPFRFKARPWELSSRASIAMHDCVGSHIFVHTIRNKVMRVIPRENEAINETWLSDRDRFSYESLNHPDRLLSPRIKQNGQWQVVSWSEALEKSVEILRSSSMDKIGGLISPSSPTEACYLLQKLMRTLGACHIDHRLLTADTQDQDHLGIFPNLGRSLESLERCDLVFIVGGNIRKDQPMINHRLRKGVRNHNTRVVTLVDYDIDWNFEVAHQQIVKEGDYVTALLSFSEKWLPYLKEGENKAILLGSQVLSHPQLSVIRYLIHKIADLIGATVGELPIGANVPGACIAGALPHRGPLGEKLLKPGLSAREMLKNPLETYLLVNIEAEYDCLNPQEAVQVLKQAQNVILMTPFMTPAMLEYATVLLPIAPLYESPGTLVNIEGYWQTMEPASVPQGEAWPSWKVLNNLGTALGLEGFEYSTSYEVMRDLNQAESLSKNNNTILEQVMTMPQEETSLFGLVRLAPRASLAVDNTVRRALSLQKTNEALRSEVIRMHPKTLVNFDTTARFQVVENGVRSKASFEIQADSSIPENSLFLYSGLMSTQDLGAPYQRIDLVSADVL